MGLDPLFHPEPRSQGGARVGLREGGQARSKEGFCSQAAQGTGIPLSLGIWRREQGGKGPGSQVTRARLEEQWEAGLLRKDFKELPQVAPWNRPGCREESEKFTGTEVLWNFEGISLPMLCSAGPLLPENAQRTPISLIPQCLEERACGNAAAAGDGLGDR